MASWNYVRLGASSKNNEEDIEQLLECLGVDIDNACMTETGYISNNYRPNCEGNIKKEPNNLIEIYNLANELFDTVFIYYSWEMGSNTSDYYKRHEEIYNPITKKINIGDAEYDYGSQEIFGENVYEVLKEKIEEEAKKQNIPIKWSSKLIPSTDEFADFCDSFIMSLGGLSTLGKKQEEKDILTNKKVTQTLIKKIADKAGKNGFIELVNVIKEKYNIVPKVINEKKKIDENEIIEKIHNHEIDFKNLNASIRNNKKIVLEAVKTMGPYLRDASKKLRADKEVVLEAVKSFGTSLQYASEELRGNKDVVLEAVKQRGTALEYANEELRANKEVVLEAIKQNGNALKYVNEKLKNDKEVVLEAVKKSGCALQYASEELRADKEVVLEAVNEEELGSALKYASEELRKDKKFVLETIKKSGCALEYASEELKADKEVVIEAVKQNGFALEYVSEELRADKGVVIEAVKECKYALEYASEELREDKEVKMAMQAKE